MASKNCIFGIPQFRTRLHSRFGGNGQKPSPEAARRYDALTVAYFKDVAERSNPFTLNLRSSFLRTEIDQQFIKPMEALEKEQEQLKAELAKSPLYVELKQRMDTVRQQQSIALLNTQMAAMASIEVTITQRGNDNDTLYYIHNRLNEIRIELSQLEMSKVSMGKSFFTFITETMADTFHDVSNDIMERLTGDRFEMWKPSLEGDTLIFSSRGDFRILQWEEEHMDDEGFYHEDPVQMRDLSPREVTEEEEANDFIVSELRESNRRKQHALDRFGGKVNSLKDEKFRW